MSYRTAINTPVGDVTESLSLAINTNPTVTVWMVPEVFVSDSFFYSGVVLQVLTSLLPLYVKLVVVALLYNCKRPPLSPFTQLPTM